jgi:hypothetical protein
MATLRMLAVSLGVELFNKEQFISEVVREISVSLFKTSARPKQGMKENVWSRLVGQPQDLHSQNRPSASRCRWLMVGCSWSCCLSSML